jgi:Spy/CpxP family protein refolding chaperone
MKSKALLIALIISLGINVGVIGTVAYRLIEGRTFRSHLREQLWKHSPLRHELHLTDEQLEEMDRMREQIGGIIQPLRERLRDKRLELIGMLRAGEPDREALDALSREIADLQSEIGLVVFDHLLEMRTVLTEEQRMMFLDLFEHELHPRGGFPAPFGHRPPEHPSPPIKHHGF